MKKELLSWGLALGLLVGCEVLPSGAIMFYDAENCPEGWSNVTKANGRVLMGAGLYNEDADQDGRNTAYSYELEEKGGNMDSILKESQMPKHQHGTAWGENQRGKYGNVGSEDNHIGSLQNDSDNYEYLSESKGDGQPFDNRMPYIAYTVCKKI